MISTPGVDIFSTNNNNSKVWDKSSATVVAPSHVTTSAAFWRKHHCKDMVSDTSLRSITPHIVRSRLTLFNNVLIDQKHALAIHNIHKKCTIHRSSGSAGAPGSTSSSTSSSAHDCGSIHFGFCRAIEEQRQSELDVQSHIDRFESVSKAILQDDSRTSDIRKQQTLSKLYIPIVRKPIVKEKAKLPDSTDSSADCSMRDEVFEEENDRVPQQVALCVLHILCACLMFLWQ